MDDSQNEKNGIIKDYYTGGKVKAETEYKDGKKNGIRKVYHENGSLMAEQYYKNDKPESTGKGYYGNGKILHEDIYKAGRLINRKSFDGVGNLVHDKVYP